MIAELGKTGQIEVAPVFNATSTQPDVVISECAHACKLRSCHNAGNRILEDRLSVHHKLAERTGLAAEHCFRAARPRDVQARGVRIPLAEDGLPSGAAIERMRDKCGEAGSSLNFDAGATVKLMLSDGTELTRHVSFGE